MHNRNFNRPKAISIISELLGQPVDSMERIGNGRNSRVYRVNYPGSERCVAKFYWQQEDGGRDRLASEFHGLKFLWHQGERAISEPIACDTFQQCAIYVFEDGEPVLSSKVTTQDIDQAVAFLIRLREIARNTDDCSLPSASEACFSVEAAIRNIGQRLDQLSEMPERDGQHQVLRQFLRNKFVPARDQVINWCRATAMSHGISLDEELVTNRRTFSPSDFGFHNALKQSSGKIVFLDFEHFGWDDPAKMISDFLLHPAMSLNQGLRQRFLNGVLDGFNDDSLLKERIEVVFPLFALKWCLILLNEFIPANMARRRFAHTGEMDTESALSGQLSKSTDMLNNLMGIYERFPSYV